MRFRIGSDAIGRRILRTIDQLMPRLGIDMEALLEAPLGCEVTIDVIRPQYTSDQERGFHFLLSEWLKLKPMPGVDKDALKKWVLSNHFGHIEAELPDGRIDWIPLRTTTRAWSHENKRYGPQKLPREQYSELIEYVYRAAAEGNVVLPELEKVA